MTIQGECGNKLDLIVEGYEHPTAQNRDDANWLSGRIVIEVGSFRGATRAAFTSFEFVGLLEALEQLVQTVDSRAAFELTEGMLTILFEINRHGHAWISGELHSDRDAFATLTFKFQSDAAFLEAAASGLRDVITAFPVIEKPVAHRS